MKDHLLDIIYHTHGLGIIDLIKVEGTATSTKISARAEDKTVVIYGDFKSPINGFDGIFGMPNLSILKTILSFDEYNENSKIYVTTKVENNITVPAMIHFETSNGDFINDYRLMAQNAVQERVGETKFKGAVWDVSFEPTIPGITRLKKQSQANNVELNFMVKVDKTDFKIYFGDHSTHSGNFVFHSDVTGKLSKPWQYPVKAFIAIMDLPGDKIVRFSDAGVAEITVDSELSTWRYLIPALVK